jgi:flagellar secretion chaperone FliS
MNPINRYAQTQNATASKERLMVLLFEAGLRHIRAGAQSLEAKNFDQALTPLTKASDIVMELSRTLDASKAPELCEKLKDLYGFVNGRLISAAISHDAKAAREAERVFGPIVEGFQGAVEKLQAEGKLTQAVR